ncbi:MAG: mannose-6-phosphate isomerase, class I [Clostridium sp.]|nr:mannose-6-phosphate isomerase, class I [Clostridium sp.]
MQIIKLEPVFKQMIWGGNRLKQDFGYAIDMENVGECWGIAAHENGDCVVANGEFAGMHLSEIFNNHRELFGNMEGDRFPLLTKLIDAEKDLSIQVHPDDEYAKVNENGASGKTECWYILDAKENATIVIGHNAASHNEVERMINEKCWKDFIREIPVKKGDFFHITPGTVHAIKGGTLLLETQQNSDITYRVYDYDRLSDGKPRQLHVKQSIDVIKAPFIEEEPEKNEAVTVNSNMQQLVSCRYFSVWKLDVKGNEAIVMDQPFMLASVIEGEGCIDKEPLKKGDHFILPFGYGAASFEGDMELILSAPSPLP